MKKKLLVGLLASSMILGLTACGDSGKGGGGIQTPQEARRMTVRHRRVQTLQEMTP